MVKLMVYNSEHLGVATTNSYVSLLKEKLPEHEYVTLVVTNSGDTNDATVKVLVSNDPEGSATSFVPLEVSTGVTETVIGEADGKPIMVSAPFHWVDVQVKSTSSSNATTVNVWLMAR